MNGFRCGVVATLTVLLVSSCGSPTPTPSARRSPTPTPATRPSAAAGPCASVTTTTAIGDVPAACAALWAPYGVTKVPPANLTDSTPSPPPVVNGTNGAVSDADAQAWALAANRAAVWYRWAEANIQPTCCHVWACRRSILRRKSPRIRCGERVDLQPDCALFPHQIRCFRLSRSGAASSASSARTSQQASFVAARLSWAHARSRATARTAIRSTLVLPRQPGSTFFAGDVRHDPLLGTIWFGNGGGLRVPSGRTIVGVIDDRAPPRNQWSQRMPLLVVFVCHRLLSRTWRRDGTRSVAAMARAAVAPPGSGRFWAAAWRRRRHRPHRTMATESWVRPRGHRLAPSALPPNNCHRALATLAVRRAATTSHWRPWSPATLPRA